MDWRVALREGVYPASFAAKLTGTTNSRVASWFKTREGSRLDPAIVTRFEPVDGQLLMPFLALVEVRFVARFRQHGLSLQTIRKVARKLRADYNLDHPFATQCRFRTDGKKVLMEQAAGDGERRIIDIMTDEFGFPDVIEPSLFETIIYAEDVATQIQFEEYPDIIIDPNYSLGRPVVKQGHIPTDTLAAAYLAEGDVDGVADWFGTTPASVIQSVGFEQRMAA